ncbi:MAG: hypothetical protein A2677_02895 [Candidatus Komeilibacteria bacterium RIFCSPHIGHO2_01_FULL_52_14]|uniref:Nudix hydrolase domain-containing protein n=1 Tax=Candidatus Komeilibacteria bacterium RIFCSPHIGHO2_01_FULL_52_14 TaxID=1798549 RepID=A0A1G2BJY5_9BACT|nr:MAG: hypothetical protein A2677_02895 [Candidatus Komeilibacteria bacterium RIFCSPHIGHO2_01_FULL_52_14]
MKWKRLTRKIKYKNPWIAVQEDGIIFPSGKKGIYGTVVMADTVAVLAMKKNQIFLVKQFRYTVHKNSWELPSGHIERGETPLAAAKRELQEEAGLKAKKWKSLGFVHPALGILNTKRYIFIAEDLSKVATAHEETEGKMTIYSVSLQKVKKMIYRNVLFDDYTIAALYKSNILKPKI